MLLHAMMRFSTLHTGWMMMQSFIQCKTVIQLQQIARRKIKKWERKFNNYVKMFSFSSSSWSLNYISFLKSLLHNLKLYFQPDFIKHPEFFYELPKKKKCVEECFINRQQQKNKIKNQRICVTLRKSSHTSLTFFLSVGQ